MAISADTVVVGAVTDSTPGGAQSGSAYVFVRSGQTWSEQQKLVASDAAADDLFGVSVSVSGDTAVVGAYADDVPGGMNAGSAYVFVRSGTTWSQQQKLLASDGRAVRLLRLLRVGLRGHGGGRGLPRHNSGRRGRRLRVRVRAFGNDLDGAAEARGVGPGR